MKCFRARRLISDHIDGELVAETAAKLEDHLRQCLRCRDLLGEMQSLVREAEQAQRVSPRADLWPAILSKTTRVDQASFGTGIMRRLSGIPYRPAFSLGALCAAVLLATVFYYALPSGHRSDVSREEGDLQAAALGHLREAERHYLLAIGALYDAISDGQIGLDPELAEVLRRNLEIIDSSILICRNAVREHPGSMDANMYLLAAYRKKMDLLNEIRVTAM